MTKKFRKLTLEEMQKRGYTDVVGNLPFRDLEYEISLEVKLRKITEMIITYNPNSKKATIYIPVKDFEAEKNENLL